MKLDQNNLPEDEVVAIGYQNEALVGYIHYDIDKNKFTCYSDNEQLEDVYAIFTIDELITLIS